ncbi:MAG: cytochrome c [Alphaproteobacteria bacterium]|nr:cytochrome c [Alphaproteobacteria bacterium]
MIKTLAFAALATAVTLSAAAFEARAEENNATILHRQGIYKVAAGHMTGLRSILAAKGGPVDNLTYHANGVLTAFQHLGDAFPPGSDKGETKAKDNIWTERAKFDKAGKNAYTAAVAMAEAAKAGEKAETRDAFKTLAGACKACHEDFRKD